ncbi:hypothetical protein HGA92_04475 [Candidatus Gracilibacteria bacterium]|nr:hypothetical protein [Candidatus Gracilibacteria bacterium]
MNLYINIGTPNACLFVFMSKKLINGLHKNPFLYYAVEEALISAKNGYYSIGIIIWYDLLKDVLQKNSQQDTGKRNISAHDILKTRPTKESYDELLEKFKLETKKQYEKEFLKSQDKNLFVNNLEYEWQSFIKELNNNLTIINIGQNLKKEKN